MGNSSTMERQNAAKTVGQVFQGQGPLTEEEEQQFKQLIEDVAEFNKRGRFKERQSSEQEQEQQTQKIEIELSTDDNSENPEEETEKEEEEE